MNRYILIPEDPIRVLPPEDGVEAAVDIKAVVDAAHGELDK